MSVPVNQRTQGKLDVCVKAHDLCCYTLHITRNKNVFDEAYKDPLTDKIVECAIEIHTLVWSANNVLVKDPASYEIRRRMQDSAASKCNILLSLIDLAWGIFHLRASRVAYWSKKTIEVRNLIRAWRDSDANRYKNKFGM